jgi:hypothetical protein
LKENLKSRILKRLIIIPPSFDFAYQVIANRWVQYFTSCDNRHALPLFTSLLNIVCGYDPSGILPYNHLLFNDSREELVEVALQVRKPLKWSK